jgi:hypothetical protein
MNAGSRAKAGTSDFQPESCFVAGMLQGGNVGCLR